MGRLAKNLLGVSVKECARQIGVSDTAIHKAIKAGRCSRLADGSVDVEAVRVGMSMTADPFRGGQRQAGVFGEVVAGTSVQSSLDSEHGQETETPAPSEPAKSTQHRPLLEARTLTEQARAEREQIELAKLKGTLAEIAPMTKAIHDAMVAARSELLAMPDRLTPLVTPEQDPAKVYSLVESEVQRVCLALQDKLKQLASSHAASVLV